ncbi:type III-B CRISPR module-associated protein Cmr3 [Myxococcus sp. RHSTA-1-4]|uniref:type III-B CRISPR module-associated protein Cmr3 n=1 Tax=Myxococcus sp. RHSTA-1-4 TaxID=2874601 RepID=UPI001CC02D11|nr:type III-B CRISPR module-associated protein Cmr3 [Myxococcus sp. RHSTA-1-4]MBZ4423278.1 type III-B CRISPR module-associated protein Cmr3 [Myxococcus sp. RHSTA-1-4]
MSDVCFALLPRDGLSPKDGRGWYTREVGRGYSHPWPPPTTVRGALRAAWGHDVMGGSGAPLPPAEWERRSEGVELRHAVALRRPLGVSFEQRHRMWPFPADAVRVRDASGVRVERLEPRPPGSPGAAATLGPDEDDAREALWHPGRASGGKPVPPPLFWTEAEMLAWLRGEPVTGPGVTDPVRRTDVHLAIAPGTQAALPSMLHSREVVETLGLERRGSGPPGAVEWALGLSCVLPGLPPRPPRGPLGLGGRRRLAAVEGLASTLFAPPGDVPREASGLRLVLATPAEFQRGWLPDGFEREEGRPPRYVGRLPGVEAPVVLRAALVPRPLDVSAWDMVARRPRPTRRWVPAGAVYFFQKRGGGGFTATELRALWLASWGGGRAEALGQVLPGVWQPTPGHGA